MLRNGRLLNLDSHYLVGITGLWPQDGAVNLRDGRRRKRFLGELAKDVHGIDAEVGAKDLDDLLVRDRGGVVEYMEEGVAVGFGEKGCLETWTGC